MEVRAEQLGFRCEKISEWHRSLGWDFPATDIDFLMVEYDRARPKALIEYKHENARKIASKHPSLLALARLSTAASLPFFVVRYTEDLISFIVIPLNNLARKHLPARQLMSGEDFKKFLLRLRK